MLFKGMLLDQKSGSLDRVNKLNKKVQCHVAVAEMEGEKLKMFLFLFPPLPMNEVSSLNISCPYAGATTVRITILTLIDTQPNFTQHYGIYKKGQLV
jgi:hypothetical protein